MYKIYEILPEYVIDALYKKRNKPINLWLLYVAIK
jgi:hypothetical protein